MSRAIRWVEGEHADDQLWVCPYCGAELDADCVGDTCPECGVKIEDEDDGVGIAEAIDPSQTATQK